MTKGEYIDFVRNSLQMVDKTNKYHPEQVAAAIDVACATVYWDMYKKNPKVMEKSLERYSVIESSSLVTSVYKARYTTGLTADVVDLPRKAGGILEIFALDGSGNMASTTTVFVPITTMEGQQLYGSEASLPANVIGFSYVGKRVIEYWGSSVTLASIATNGVKVRFIQRFRSFTTSQNVMMPYGQDDKIIGLVREYLGAIPPKDLVNNEADMQK